MKKFNLLLALIFSVASLPANAAVVFTNGSAWNYKLGVAEASTPGDAWRAPGFDDSTWATGNTPVGYGETEVVTVVPTSSSGGYTTIYLRKSFVLADASAVGTAEMTFQVDDGVVVWLNGIEIGRTNVPAGNLAYNALASTAPSQFFPYTIVLNASSSPSLGSVLRTGNNVMAIHLINGSQGSSDIFIDATLSTTAPDFTAPVIASLVPAAGSTVNDLTQVTVNFSEPVKGVDAADLQINGVPTSGVTGSGSTYTFSFPQPRAGAVTFTWATTHGITDLASPANPFDRSASGNTWSYTVQDIAPPTVASVAPPIGSTLRSLGDITVTFAEDVTGVDAGDLLVNGIPATSYGASSPREYIFRFNPPGTGTVTVAWAAGHGIADYGLPPNSFAGGSWTYRLDPNAAANTLVISEFMASNTRSLPDEDGEASDWIEIHNYGPAPIDLLEWSLTDDIGDLTKWSFPSTNINPGAYLVVFASNKDRRMPGRQLHTNFRLTGAGEYLGLVHNRTNVVSQYAPTFPAQVADVSYGLNQNVAEEMLVATNAPVRILVPTNNIPAATWTDPNFNDSAWLVGLNGVGFEPGSGEPGETPYGPLIVTDIRSSMHGRSASAYLRYPFQVTDPTQITSMALNLRYDDGLVVYLNGAVVASRNAPLSAVVADSLNEFSGVQGQDNWFYGYYNQTADTSNIYSTNKFTLFPKDNGPFGPSNYWTGSAWDWPNGNPPWTTLEPNGGHPNGNNNGQVHWAIRRWTSEVSGTIKLNIRYAKSNTGGGNGTTARVMRNGTQVFTYTVAGTDGVGINTSVTLTNVQFGDLLDFAMDPLGTDGTQADGSDGTIFTVSIEYVAPELNNLAAATMARSNVLGREFESIDLVNVSRWLVPGNNVLAVHGLNVHSTNADFLVQATLTARRPLPLSEGTPRYFVQPTPGGPNGAGVQNLGPIISGPGHSPAQPAAGEPLYVSAAIAPSFSPVVTNILVYRVMYGTEVSVPMLDDGAHGDGAAGDGIYGGIIPAGVATNGQMIRWYIISRDSANRSSRWPFYTDPLRTPQYLGTVVKNPVLTNPLPVLHWFIPSATGADSDAGSRASIYYLGRFYDNVYMNLHGQSTRGFPKKSYDVSFNPGYKFTYREGAAPVGDINWITTYADKSHMRNALAYEAFAALGSPYHWVEPVRVQQNGNFYGTAHLLENGDDEFLDRLGLNTDNPLYKMYNTFTTSPTHANLGTQNVEKKSRKYEGSADLQALLSGVLQTGEAQRNFIYDNLDLPEIINSMAVRALIGEQDCCHKNYYFYRDTHGDGEWEIWPWDVDLSYGRRWISGPTYFDDTMVIDTRMPVGDNNGLLIPVYNTPEIRSMYWRRMRTLMDEFLQAPGTPTNQLRIEKRIEDYVAKIAPDAALDLAKWGTFCCGQIGPFSQANIPIATNYQSLRQAADIIRNVYLPQRRTYLFTNRIVGAGGEIPNAQPTDSRVLIAQFEANPASGNQAQEYLALTNGNSYAVDISGWRIEGAVSFTFKAGTVVPAGRLVYVSPDVRAFRARATSPRGGQSLLVVGGYSGQLSARGETLRLVNARGLLVDKWAYPASPSLAQQQLRITEIMYHPEPMAGNTNSAELFEYLELRNIGPVALNLTGVRFTNGISYSFSGSAVTNLAPGARVLVVRDAAQFALRYPTVPPNLVAGQFTGALDNGGERLRLIDATGEDILDFSYNNSWHRLTDGYGFSLVAVDELAESGAWGRSTQWRASGSLGGSPGQVEGSSTSFAAIRVNEALARPSGTATDKVELYNPTSNPVDIGGWYLSDDLGTPAKYRFPASTVIPAGGYLVIDQTQWSAGGGGFGLSSSGDEVALYSADAAGNLSGYFNGHDFGAAESGVSFGRYVTTDGREPFVAQKIQTFGATNAEPVVGPIVITELMYHPPDVLRSSGMLLPTPADNTTDEFVEIRNIASTNVALYLGTNAWRLGGGVSFTLPLDVMLGPGEFLLFVNFDPMTNATAATAFRSLYNVPAGVRLFGPYKGKLNNDEDNVELKRPIQYPAGVVHYGLADKVSYKDAPPWPAGADGFGYSLQRWNQSAYGNDPANWVAALPGAAAPTGTNNLPPTFALQPQSRVVSAGSSATLMATVTGSGPLHYQWYYHGAPIAGATNVAFQLNQVALEHEGRYTLLARNSAGAVLSAPAELSVVLPPVITAAPTNILVRIAPDSQAAPTTNVTFTVGTFSRSPLSYQWRFNGTNVPGATGASLSITNVNTNHLGYATVLISDGATTVETAPAYLYPLVSLLIVQSPRGQEVVAGRPVTLSVEYTGFPPPYTVEWQLGAVGQVTNQQMNTADYFQFMAPSVSSTQNYRVIVRNQATPGGRASTFARIVTLADSDSDGIPDEWEIAHGMNPNSASDAAGDLDGDGFLNWEEYVAGTGPADRNSFLKVVALRATPTTPALEFNAVSNRTYTVEYTDRLGTGPWNRLVDVPARATNRVVRADDDTTGPRTNRIYRLVTPRRP